VLQSSIGNLLQLVGDLLAEGSNVEVDLHEFGKFSSIQRQVIYAPFNKQKPAALQGKQTVKSLMDLSSQEKPKPTSKLPGIKGTNGNELSSVNPSKIHGASMQSQGLFPQNSIFRSGISPGDSPTRRYKKPQGDARITTDLLGAGDDPMSKH